MHVFSGLLKAKLAKYRAELLEPSSKSGGAGTGFEVQKAGDAVRAKTVTFQQVYSAIICSAYL
jgi:uncharacterized protein